MHSMPFRCPKCGNDLLPLKILNEEQRRLVAQFYAGDVQKCEVCDLYFDKDMLKKLICNN